MRKLNIYTAEIGIAAEGSNSMLGGKKVFPFHFPPYIHFLVFNSFEEFFLDTKLFPDSRVKLEN